jgi:hypothetical protein
MSDDSGDLDMQPITIPWEVYDTRLNAIQALANDSAVLAPEKPLGALEPLVIQEVRGVTCVLYDWETWTQRAVPLQPLLKSLVTDFGRDRIVLDFSNQACVGTPSIACIYSLWMPLAKVGGRFGLCHLNRTLLEFFRWHDRDKLTFPQESKSQHEDGDPLDSDSGGE